MRSLSAIPKHYVIARDYITLVSMFAPARKSLLVVGLFLALSISAQHSAFAHGELLNAIPVPDFTLSQLPQSIALEFNEILLTLGGPKTNNVRVEDEQGVQIHSGEPKVTDSTLAVDLQAISSSGKYHVTYRIVSKDGHPVEGGYYFFVDISPIADIPEKQMEEKERKSHSEVAIAVGVLVITGFLFALLIMNRRKQKGNLDN